MLYPVPKLYLQALGTQPIEVWPEPYRGSSARYRHGCTRRPERNAAGPGAKQAVTGTNYYADILPAGNSQSIFFILHITAST